MDLSAEFSFYAAVGGNAPLPVLVRAEIDPSNVHKEQDETNNRFPLNGPSHFTVNFYDNEPVTIIGKRIRYKEDGKEYKAQGPSLEGQAADWFQHIAEDHPRVEGFRDILAAGEPVCGRLHPDKNALLYGVRADEVQSSALLALPGVGLVAVGSRDANRFFPGMGTLFLRMMGEALAAGLRRFG